MREQMLENSEVNWSNTPVDEEELRELCVQLKAPECSIKAIILDNSASPIGGAEQNGMEYRLLFKALQVNRSVTYLSLIGNHMTSEAITTCLVPMLKANSTLQQLNLQDNKLYGSDLLAVTEALRTNPQSALSVLILTANPVGKIQGFNLKISEATFNGITQNLEANSTIQEVKIDQESMSESRLRQVERAANKIHHKLYNAISSLDRPLVLELLKHYGSQLQPRDKQYQGADGRGDSLFSRINNDSEYKQAFNTALSQANIHSIS